MALQPNTDQAPSSLFSAVRNGTKKDVLKALQGRDVNARDAHGRTAMMWACCKNQSCEIAKLLASHGAGLEHASLQNGRTPLSYACEHNAVKTVNWLLFKGVQRNAHDTREGWTPLMYACNAGHNEVVRALVTRRATVQYCDLEVADRHGNTALMIAASKGHTDIIMKLLRCGANRDAVNGEGCNAARCATQKRRTNASQALRTWVPSRKRPRSAPGSGPNDNTGLRSASAGSTPTSIVTSASTAVRSVPSTTGAIPRVPSHSRPDSTSSGIRTKLYQLLLTVGGSSVLTSTLHVRELCCFASAVPSLVLGNFCHQRDVSSTANQMWTAHSLNDLLSSKLTTVLLKLASACSTFQLPIKTRKAFACRHEAIMSSGNMPSLLSAVNSAHQVKAAFTHTGRLAQNEAQRRDAEQRRQRLGELFDRVIHTSQGSVRLPAHGVQVPVQPSARAQFLQEQAHQIQLDAQLARELEAEDLRLHAQPSIRFAEQQTQHQALPVQADNHHGHFGSSSEPDDPMDTDTDTDEEGPSAAVAEHAQDQRPECLICLDPLENDIAVFGGCGHARTHFRCATRLTCCPECRIPGSAVKLYL